MYFHYDELIYEYLLYLLDIPEKHYGRIHDPNNYINTIILFVNNNFTLIHKSIN
jgi:hypothetical protein